MHALNDLCIYCSVVVVGIDYIVSSLRALDVSILSSQIL